jgi:hypothetical protein
VFVTFRTNTLQKVGSVEGGFLVELTFTVTTSLKGLSSNVTHTLPLFLYRSLLQRFNGDPRSVQCRQVIEKAL